MAQFSLRDVKRAFRSFNDMSSDLFRADFRTWGDSLHRLLEHCERNPVMSVIVAPLKSNNRVNVKTWYATSNNTIGGMIGSGRYSLPVDEEDRTALVYQLLLAINAREISLDTFCMNFFGKTKYQEMVDVFNQEIVVKFTRDIAYRLDEIEEDTSGQESVGVGDLIVFNHYDQSTVVHGNVTGGNINIGPGIASGQNITINSIDDLVSAFSQLKAELSHPLAVAACDEIIKQVRANNDVAAMTEAANTILQNEPTKANKLREVLERIGTSLVASTIFQTIKVSLGF